MVKETHAQGVLELISGSNTLAQIKTFSNLNLTHVLNAQEPHHCKASTTGQRPQRLSKQGWDIPKPLSYQHLKLPRTIYWVTATHELPLLLSLCLQSGIRTTHWNHYYSFLPQLFLFQATSSGRFYFST